MGKLPAPKHFGHKLERARTVAAILQVILTALVALRVFEIV